MATEKRLIFITSDEGLIQQISLKKPKNTHFIDLDTGEQIKSISSDKSVCLICGDRAIGYNYDVMSCASCKAFFHRHANENPESLKCSKGKGQCVIDYRTHRRCFRCRLNKCLLMGMRKDFLVRKKPDPQNILSTADTSELDDIDRLLLNINENDINNILDESHDIMSLLTNEDLAIIHHVQTSFLSIFENLCETIPESFDLSNQTSAIMFSAQANSDVALRTINFFRQINEFENLHSDDRFILIKYNLFPLMNVRKTFNYRPTNNRTLVEIENEKKRSDQFYKACGVSDEMNQDVNGMINLIIQYTEHDTVLLSLLLLIGLFSPTLSLDLNEPPFRDSLSVYQAQALYTEVLWNYLLDKYGEAKTYEKFSQIVVVIFQIQRFTVKQRSFTRDLLTATNTVDKITTLMQTVLHI